MREPLVKRIAIILCLLTAAGFGATSKPRSLRLGGALRDAPKQTRQGELGGGTNNLGVLGTLDSPAASAPESRPATAEAKDGPSQAGGFLHTVARAFSKLYLCFEQIGRAHV